MYRLVNAVFSLACIAAGYGLLAGESLSAQSSDITDVEVSGTQSIPGAFALVTAIGDIDDNRNGFLGETRWWQQSVSGSFRYHDVSLGLSAAYTRSKKDLDQHVLTSGPNVGQTVLGGTTKSRSVLLIGNVTYRIGDWNINALAGYGRGETDEFRRGPVLTATWERDFTIRTAGAGASTLVDLGNSWYVRPDVRFAWIQTISEATTDSLNQTINEKRDRLSRGAVGGELGHESFFGDLIGKLGVRAHYVYDFHRAENFTDKSAVDVAAFATFAGDDVVGGLELSTTLARDDTDSIAGRVFLAVRF